MTNWSGFNIKAQLSDELDNRRSTWIDSSSDKVDALILQQSISKASEVQIHVEVDLQDRSHAISLRRKSHINKYENKFNELVESIRALSPLNSFDPSRIIFFQNSIKLEGQVHFQDTMVRPNRRLGPLRSSQPIPRIGAFEVTLAWRGRRVNAKWRRIVLFSKIDSGRWPHISSLVETIKDVVTDPLDMVRCATCAAVDWSASEQKSDLVNTFFEVTWPEGPDGVADCLTCGAEDWTSLQQKNDLVNTFVMCNACTGVISDFCECLDCSPVDWTALQQRADLVNVFLEAQALEPKVWLKSFFDDKSSARSTHQKQSPKQIQSSSSNFHKSASSSEFHRNPSGPSPLLDRIRRRVTLFLTRFLYSTQASRIAVELLSNKTFDLCFVEAKLYTGGLCSASGACDGHSSVAPVELSHPAMNDDRTLCQVQLYLWGLVAGQTYWLVFSSEFFYPRALELRWPLAKPARAFRVPLVDRAGPGCLRVALTSGARLDGVALHVTNVPVSSDFASGGWDALPDAHHVHRLNRGPCWNGVALDGAAEDDPRLVTVTFESAADLGSYPLVVRLHSDGRDACFGDGAADLAVDIFDEEGLVARECPEPSVIGAVQGWYVGDVAKSAAGFRFEGRGLPLGPQVGPPVCALPLRCRSGLLNWVSNSMVYAVCALPLRCSRGLVIWVPLLANLSINQGVRNKSS